MMKKEVKLSKTELKLDVFECENCDFKIAVVGDIGKNKSCDLYYLTSDGKYEFLSGLKRKDGLPLTEDEIFSHVGIAFGF